MDGTIVKQKACKFEETETLFLRMGVRQGPGRARIPQTWVGKAVEENCCTFLVQAVLLPLKVGSSAL